MQILLFMGIPVELPVKVWVDNIGAIFMMENASSSSRTRHMDTRSCWIRSYTNEGLLDLEFVPLAQDQEQEQDYKGKTTSKTAALKGLE